MKRQNKWYVCLALALCAICSAVFAACGKEENNHVTPPEPPAPVLTLSQTSAQLDLHEQIQLTVAEQGMIVWTSSNTAVCTVDNGLVKSVGAGLATVTASAGEAKAECVITVTNSRSAARINLSDNGSTVGAQVIKARGDEFSLAANVTYKGNPVDAADVSEMQWTIVGDIVNMTEAEDKKSATFTCGNYGSATVSVAATVWGEPISAVVTVNVRNAAVVFSSQNRTPDEDGAYATTIKTVEENGTACEEALDIACKDGETNVASTDIIWTYSKANVAKVEDGKIVALGAGETTITGTYQGCGVDITVTVNKPAYTLAAQTVSLFDKLKDTLRTTYPTEQTDIDALRAKTVTIDLPATVAGTVSEVNVEYNQVVENKMTTVRRNILTDVNGENARKITVRPSYYTYNLGEKTAIVVTDKAVYTLPLTIYTMQISDADELDAFRYYTTYQNDLKKTTHGDDAYAPTFWDGYFVLDDNIEYNSTSAITAIQTSTWNGTYNADDVSKVAALRKYESFITAYDMSKFAKLDWKNKNNVPATTQTILCGDCFDLVGNYGFCGIFDGMGYAINGLLLKQQQDRAYNQEDEKVISGQNTTLENVGGFIGMLTSNSEGGVERYGTIRNVAFTNAVHGKFWIKTNANDSYRLSNWGGLLYSVIHSGVVVENVYLDFHVLGNGMAIGVDYDWFIQLSRGKAQNILVNVQNSLNNGAIFGKHYCWVNPKDSALKNIYGIAQYNNVARKAHWLTGNNGIESIVPTDCSKDMSGFVSSTGVSATDLKGFDANYWEFKNSALVFKTKTNA